MHLSTLSILLATATTAFAQNDFNLDKTTPGTLGSFLGLQVSAAPASALGMVMLSFSGGPTAISAFDPADSRSVQVGLDLSATWSFTVMSPTGAASINLGLPSDPSYADLRLHWQVATLATSGPTLVGQISNDVVTQCSVAGTSLPAPANLTAARGFAVSLFDRNNNAGAGDVLIAGGGAGTLTAATGLASTELWDFRHMRRQAGPNMTVARALHLGIELNDGRVLMIGGADATGTVLASCELYSPTTNSFTATGSMATARVLHAACRLADGRVMVAGGTSSLVDTTTAITSTLNSVEIWNPTTGQWTAGPNLGGRRLAPALTLLSTNQVMVSGGVEVGFLFGIPISAVSTTAVQRWNPASPNAWSSGAAMSQGRAGHQYNQVTLNDGRVLMTGGTLVPNLLGAANATPISGAELYNPTTNTWATANMNTPRALHSATKLSDGRVVVCGGAQGTLTTPVSIDGVEVFNPATNGWTGLAPLTAPRAGQSAALLPDGTVVLFGGQGATATVNTIETLRF
ncbi:MAG: hypothetical protein IT456_03765 [Planctomycetes bacterium]|nr:hypothetical protein [Planctomycetota bacterium]